MQRTQVVEVSSAAEATAAVSVASTEQLTDQSAGRLPELVQAVSPPALTGEDYDNRCLPIFFTWRRKTTIPTDAGNNLVRLVVVGMQLLCVCLHGSL